MKRITAIIKPFKLDAAIEALKGQAVEQLLIREVRGYGRQKGHLELYQGTEYEITFLPKVRLECWVPATAAESVVEALLEACRTGRIGDGKIFIQDGD
ncbi:MAG: P-II family nitrogen regulator [Planctomycetota bacterium]